MNGEKSRRTWSVIGATLNDQRLSPITIIKRKKNRQTVKYTDSKGVNKVFREECENRFTLARKAPIMGHGLESLGDIAKDDMFLATDTIKGKTELPDDMDKATKIMIEECIAIAKGNKREFKDKTAITAGRFMSF